MKKTIISILFIVLSFFLLFNNKVYSADGVYPEIITETEYNNYPSNKKIVIDRSEMNFDSFEVAEFEIAISEEYPSSYWEIVSEGNAFKFITKNGSSVTHYKYSFAYTEPEVIYDFINDWEKVGDYSLNSIILLNNKNYYININGLSNIEFRTTQLGYADLEVNNITFKASWNDWDNTFDITIKSNDQYLRTYIGINEGEIITFRYFDNFEEEEIQNVNNLPSTDSNKLGTVFFEIDNYNLLINIFYNNKNYFFTKSFSGNTDMSIFETLEAYYINTNNKPQIIINHSDRLYLKDILEAPEDEKPAFVSHSIWDLKTNEIKTVSDYKTNILLKHNDEGVLIAYVYIDEYIIDKMLSAHLTWYLRYENNWWQQIFGDKYSEWFKHDEVLYSDEYLEYKDLSRDWENYVPVFDDIRGIFKLFKIYEMPRIDYVDWDDIQPEYNVTKSEVEEYFSKVNTDFNQLKSNPRYKLWAFALVGGVNFVDKIKGYSETDIYNSDDINDPMNIKIISIKYETNGKLYEALGNDMTILPIKPEKPDSPNKFIDKINEIINLVAFFFLAIMYFLILYKTNGFKNIKTFLATTILFLIVVAGLILIYKSVILLRLVI